MISLILGGLGTSSAVTDQEPTAFETFLEDNGAWVGVLVMIVLVTFAILWTAAAYRRQARQTGMVPAARAAGLHYSPSDPFSCTSIAFPLFGVGDGRQVTNVMWDGDEAVQPARVFDFEFYDEHKDEQGRVSRSYSYFTCAMARHNGLWPPIRVIRERVLDKVFQKAGLPDIELESEEFNRLFVVQCENRKFATDLLSPEMMDYLLATEGELAFETKGRWLLVTSKRLNAIEMPALLKLTEHFLSRIPPVIWDLYPKAPDAPDDEFGISFGELSPSVSDAMIGDHRERRAAAPAIEYDLDGNPIEPAEENPW